MHSGVAAKRSRMRWAASLGKKAGETAGGRTQSDQAMKRDGPIPETVDEYLAPLSDEKRTALQKLRLAIKAAAPKAEECISYRMPAYRMDGRMIVAFGAAANHCAFYAGSTPIERYASELEGYDTSKGTIRFQPDDPLPPSLVRKLVKAQITAKTVTSMKAERRST